MPINTNMSINSMVNINKFIYFLKVSLNKAKFHFYTLVNHFPIKHIFISCLSFCKKNHTKFSLYNKIAKTFYSHSFSSWYSFILSFSLCSSPLPVNEQKNFHRRQCDIWQALRAQQKTFLHRFFWRIISCRVILSLMKNW